MAVIRVNKTKNYTVMSNTHLREKKMSLKAKGLLSMMLSLPDEWNYSISGLVSLCKENESAVRSALNELKQFGYLVITKKMPNETENGKIAYEYDVYEQPCGNQGVENLHVDSLYVEERAQLNTKEVKTKEANTEEVKERKNDTPKIKKTFNEIFQSYTQNPETLRLLGEWLKVRKSKRAAMTDYAIQLNIEKLDKLAKESNLTVDEYLKEVIARGWTAFYAVKGVKKEKEQEEPQRWGGIYL